MRTIPLGLSEIKGCRLRGAGMTILVITHDLAVAQLGERTITIRDGRLTEEVRR
ncbi:hypothetical protein [Streptomyces tanashiensis]|uniref:hypothetical protein n=1 Tax=Streptomyces tanashiensis TaxID=67367 RepID=UPI0034071888